MSSLQHCEGEDWNCPEDNLNFCQIFTIKQVLHFITLM